MEALSMKITQVLRPEPAEEACQGYLLFQAELSLSATARTLLYTLGLAYCFLGLSAITARFFRSMETVVKQTREVVVGVDPATGSPVVKREKIWNYTIADITLLAFGTSFPQISLATIDAIRNMGQLYSGGLGPGTLVGSAAFDLFPIHAVCVIVPKAGELKKISDLGVWIVELFWSFWAYIWLYIILEVWTPTVVTLLEALLTVLQFGLLLLHAYAQDKQWRYVSIPLERSDRPEEWVPEEESTFPEHNRMDSSECSQILEVGEAQNTRIVDIFSIHSAYDQENATINCIRGNENMKICDSANSSIGSVYQPVPCTEEVPPNQISNIKISDEVDICAIWRKQFMNALVLESTESKKINGFLVRMLRMSWQLVLLPWRILFAFVPPYQLAHGWIAFICSLIFISAIAYLVTMLTDAISCVTGINPYVIAFTALASGTSWPDLVASKIAAERQLTADSAIANITCSNSVNIYIGIGVPWVIDTMYNFFAYRQALQIPNAEGLSFSLLVFFVTSAGCIVVLVLRRILLGGELGGPRLWAWVTSAYFIVLWLVFVSLSSLKVSGII